ncbi:universal stress protein [Microlunatus spumicola]|uniref:Universal stress protein n=1 Tax=Microlunatus spumicola TaxID=81499 RepID=A0ABP6WFH3_9ACTN
MTELTGETGPATGGGPRIVVGYSSRPEGRAALRRALTEARLRGAELVVLHGPDDDLDELTRDLAAADVTYRLKASSDAADAGEDLVELAEDTDAAFIVIGLRRRSPVGKLLLGSNAQRVLLDASCPVLAVKAEQP